MFLCVVCAEQWRVPSSRLQIFAAAGSSRFWVDLDSASRGGDEKLLQKITHHGTATCDPSTV
jgi:hypothetical protein